MYVFPVHANLFLVKQQGVHQPWWFISLISGVPLDFHEAMGCPP